MRTVKSKILLITCAVITLFAVSGYSATCLASEQTVQMDNEYHKVKIKTVCIGGNLFVIASSYRGVGITQVYEGRKAHLPPQPKKCKK